MIPKLLDLNYQFPDPNIANEDGIVAWGGDLHPKRLINAYKNGIFPWYAHDEPIIWWSPNPRLILELNDFKISKSLKKNLKKFTYKFDKNFLQVIQNCSNIKRKKQAGTWIQKEIIEAYSQLHEMKIAHSVETYYENELVGGLYGLSIGKIFCGESMFAYKSDASKAALAILVYHLQEWGYELIDCQVRTSHLVSLGAKEITRKSFLTKLHSLKNQTQDHTWNINNTIIKQI